MLYFFFGKQYTKHLHSNPKKAIKSKTEFYNHETLTKMKIIKLFYFKTFIYKG